MQNSSGAFLWWPVAAAGCLEPLELKQMRFNYIQLVINGGPLKALFEQPTRIFDSRLIKDILAYLSLAAKAYKNSTHFL